jgi:hypothetical protein
MFSDLVGSTALSARIDPEDLREVISAYQNCVAETVRRFDGFVAKYLNTSTRLPVSSDADSVTPVMLLPGRARLATIPARSGSATSAITIGIVVVARFAARAGGVAIVTIALGPSATSSAASFAKASGSYPPNRYSTLRFLPSI